MHRAHVEGRGYDARPERHQGQGRGDQRPRIRPVVARDENRALLRPDRLAPPHHRDRDREPVPRRRARRRDPVHVREQYPDRDHCRHQHPPGTLVRLHGAFPARQVGEPALDRGGRFRHHRRFLGRGGREHLPQPGLGQLPRPAPQGADQALRARDRPCALVFHPDHGVRLRAAVCHVRRGGTALPAHGADLRVLPGRRPGAVHDAVSGVVHDALQEFQAGPGEHARPCLEVPLPVRNSSSASGIPRPPVS